MKKQILLIAFCLLLMQSAFALTVSVNDYDPKPAEAGTYVNVWIKVDNQQDELVEYTTITLIPKDGLTLSNGESNKRDVGSLDYGAYKIEKFKLKVSDDAIEGANSIEIEVDSQRTSFTKELEIEVTEKDKKEVILDVAKIESTPKKIKPGDEDITFDAYLQNIGDTTAKATKAKLINLPKGVTFTDSYSDIALLGNLENDGVSKVTYYLNLEEDVLPGVYDTQLNVSYKYKPYEDEDDYIITSEIFDVELRIKPIPLYEITNVDFNTEGLRAGDKLVPMTITIKNTGYEEGNSIRVKAYEKAEQPFSFKVNNNFVAPSLKPNETAQTTLEFNIDEDAYLQNYTIDIEVKNIVYDDVIVYEKTITVPVELAKKNNPVMFTVGTGSIMVIGFFGLIGLLNKTKKKKRK